MKHRKDQEEGTLDTPMGQTGIRDRAKESISSKNLHPHGSNCKVSLVHPESIDAVWNTVYAHIELMSPHSEGELLPEDFYEALISGDMQLWIATNDGEIMASMISQVIPYPQKTVLRIISIGGESMGEWLQFLPTVEDWALAIGCTSLECWGRKGWLKILKDWECSYHVLTKDLKGRMH